LNEINDLVNPTEQKRLVKAKEFAMPNFIEEAEMLEWAGVCFGEEDTYRLAKSIKVNSKMLIPVVATGSYEWRR